MNDYYSRDDMIKAVECHLIKKKYEVKIYDPTFEPARVPIFAFKSKNKSVKRNRIITSEIFVDIITEENVNSDFYFKDREISRILGSASFKIEMASSAQFFRHYFPSAKIYWAVPDYAVNNSNFKLFENNCKRQLIGLFIVKRKKQEKKDFLVNERLDGIPLLNERFQKIEPIFQVAYPEDKKKYLKIRDLLEHWTHEDLSYHIYYPEPTFSATDISAKEKKIGTELINRISDLQNLSYKDKLSKFSTEYRSESSDDNKIAQRVIEELWCTYHFPYPKLHIEYESVLKLDPDYRDHFLHAFQVFLFGAYIIDKFHAELKGNFLNDKGGRIEDAWLIAATYHDYNYMVQRFKNWTEKFFETALHIKKDSDTNNPASLQLTETYVKNGYMFKTQVLAKTLMNERMDADILKFLYDRILVKYNHGLLSGLSLLQYLELFKKDCLLKANVHAAACKAISIHDMDIWIHLSGLADGKSKDDKIGKKLNKKKIIGKLQFDTDPISFLLILADSIQEQGREINDDVKVELESLYEKDNKIYSGITFAGCKSGEAFKRKMRELEIVSKFLDGNKRFNISILDKSADQSHTYSI